ncbi:hypothetical protein JAAARDRAFT_203706 [Jaapia argillacea MUCL 33604]|uniref:GCF C-terminal domain-containing protein n=1 Tax=Jaapia argillacea MUCL 33604 TaxID=933084 RepID=A0A067Q8V3_9AGAM|nr:hypothetical protein JAAARDRAFT_203706 [Jaapia argillacea MUCL 33604]
MDGPVIFKRTKSKGTQRARDKSPEGNGVQPNTASGDESSSPSSLAAKLKKKARSKPKSRLSFGAGEEEDEGEVFQIKKSNLSRKISLGGSSASSGPVPVGSVTGSPRTNGTPVYDATYLSQLKASTPSSRPRIDADESYDVSMSLDDGEIAPVTEIADVFGKLWHAFSASNPSLFIVDCVCLADGETTIHSESSIQAAKAKRERIRTTQTTVSEDFISLSLTKHDNSYQGPHPESRLVREEDELGEVEEGLALTFLRTIRLKPPFPEFSEYTSAQERIALGKKGKKLEAKKRREEMQELIADADEVDDETMEWEQEQLRRGGYRPEDSTEATKQTYKAASIPMETPIPTLSAAIFRLTQSLTSLTTSHAQNTTSMTTLAEERTQLETREQEMRDMIAKAEAKRSWFAAFREWVESVATFLDEKYPPLEKLEDEHVSLLKERRDMITKRRRTDDEDDLSLFLGSLPVQAQTEELDELGRSVPQPNSSIARREHRVARTRRHARHKTSDIEEGFSTDSSLPPSDSADYETALAALSAKVKDILSDVQVDEFKDPSLGIGRWFGEWRERFADSYTGAWGGLGLVGAWEFWVRLELVGWDPIEDPRSLDAFEWYTSLYTYSRPRKDEEDDEPELGPDGDLVSAMISTAVIPRLCKLIGGGAFDPYSDRHVRRMIDLAEQVESSVQDDNLKFQALQKAVFQSFHDAVTALLFVVSQHLTLSNPRFDPEAIPARRRVLARVSKILSNILRWRRYSSEVFGIGELATKLVRDGLLLVAETGWEVGGEEASRKAHDSLPKELIPLSLKRRLGLP